MLWAITWNSIGDALLRALVYSVCINYVTASSLLWILKHSFSPPQLLDCFIFMAMLIWYLIYCIYSFESPSDIWVFVMRLFKINCCVNICKNVSVVKTVVFNGTGNIVVIILGRWGRGFKWLNFRQYKETKTNFFLTFYKISGKWAKYV